MAHHVESLHVSKSINPCSRLKFTDFPYRVSSLQVGFTKLQLNSKQYRSASLEKIAASKRGLSVLFPPNSALLSSLFSRHHSQISTNFPSWNWKPHDIGHSAHVHRSISLLTYHSIELLIHHVFKPPFLERAQSSIHMSPFLSLSS